MIMTKLSESDRLVVIRVIGWLKKWCMEEHANAVINLLTEYELLTLEMSDWRDNGTPDNR